MSSTHLQASPAATPVLRVADLRTHFVTDGDIGKPVDGVSFDIHEGETLGLVGESGSGKTLTALSIIGLQPPPAQIVGGRIEFFGENLVGLSNHAISRYRGKHIGLILQDPTSALNPLFTIGDQIGESVRLHKSLKGQPLRRRVIELLDLVQIPAARDRYSSYPHELSGGMRQRVVAAIALAGEPELVIADEPTTSLDVTIQAAFLATLREIQARTKIAILLITHDFAVVRNMCHRVVVMYNGRIMESSGIDALEQRPGHPYTEALLKAVPRLDAGRRRLVSIEGQPPSIFRRPKGCPFAPRCGYAMEVCREEFPPTVETAPGQHVACWLRV